MNRIVGELRLGGERPPVDFPFARVDRTRALAIDDRSARIEVALSTLTACWFQIGARRMLVWGDISRGATNIRSQDEIARLMEDLASDANRALRQLVGSWSLVFIDMASRQIVLAADRAAQRPVCYLSEPDRLVFGLSARDVATAADKTSEIRPQAIFDYLRSHVIPAPDTIFAGVLRLQPGECVVVSQSGAKRSFYWTPAYTREGMTGFPTATAKARMTELLEQAVKKHIKPGDTGAFLSGGTDSSSIAGMIGKITGEPAPTYSIGFDAPGFDEMEYARIAARHFKTKHHEYYVTPDDLVASIPNVARAYDQPFGNSSALPAYYCAHLATVDGITRMLGGDGGDEIFGGNSRYVKQTIFDAYRFVPPIVDRSLVEAVLMRPMLGKRVPLLRKARSYVVQARVSMPERLHTYNLLGRLGRDIFTDHFLSSVNPETQEEAERNWYERCEAKDLVNRMLHYDWKYTLADNDLPKVITTCDLAGTEVRFPMLDEELVEFANALPPSYKVSRLRLRPFFKAALSSFLPNEIIEKKKHGFGLPFGLWFVKHDPLRRLALGTLESFRDRGVFRASFLDEFLDKRLPEHVGYYAEFVWITMMLEQWLQALPSHMKAPHQSGRESIRHKAVSR